MKNRMLPFGYAMKDGRIVTDREEKEIVLWIFREYLNGKNMKKIADILTEKRITYLPEEYHWNKSRIKRMLEDSRYTGTDKYPQIVGKTVFEQVSIVKSQRCTTKNPIADRNTKPILYAVICENCGAEMKHRTDRRAKQSETWLCTNPKCQRKSYLTLDKIRHDVMQLMNKAIGNPEIIVSDKDCYEKSNSQVRLADSEVERMLAQEVFDKKEIQRQIIECALQKYRLCQTTAHITERLKTIYRQSVPMTEFSAELFEETVSAIILKTDNSVEIVLHNGNYIGERNDDLWKQ